MGRANLNLALPVETMSVYSCPSCGAPLVLTPERKCKYCGVEFFIRPMENIEIMHVAYQVDKHEFDVIPKETLERHIKNAVSHKLAEKIMETVNLKERKYRFDDIITYEVAFKYEKEKDSENDNL